MMYDIQPWNFSITVLRTPKAVSSFVLNNLRQVLQAGFLCCTYCIPPFQYIPIRRHKPGKDDHLNTLVSRVSIVS